MVFPSGLFKQNLDPLDSQLLCGVQNTHPAVLQHHTTASPVWQLISFALAPCWLAGCAYRTPKWRHPQPVTEVYTEIPHVSPWQDGHKSTMPMAPKRLGRGMTALQWCLCGVNNPPPCPFTVPHLHQCCQILSLTRSIGGGSCLVNCRYDIDLVQCRGVFGLAPAVGKITRLQQICHWGREHSSCLNLISYTPDKACYSQRRQGEQYSALEPVFWRSVSKLSILC